MATTMTLRSAPGTALAPMFAPAATRPSIPTTRSVPSLAAALRAIRRVGGRVTSETRTVPGIGSWAFVAEADGTEIVVWQDAPAIGA